MKYSIFNEDQDKIYYAHPYYHETKDVKDPEKNIEFHRLTEPYIYDENASFFTKTFFVRYAEELVVLRDVVKFRTEIDVKPGYLDTEFFLKVELFWYAPNIDVF